MAAVQTRTRLAVLSACALLLAPLGAQAQAQQGATYRCTGTDGKKYYGSTIPSACLGRPIEQLNAQGLLVRRIDPEGEEKERAEKAAAQTKKQEQDIASKEESRRNRALLATYTSEKDIEEARARALADNQKQVREAEGKIEAIRKRRAQIDKQLEFYQDKKGKSKAPAVMQDEINQTQMDLKVQEDFISGKKKEVETINAKYDEDKKRYTQLTRGGK